MKHYENTKYICTIRNIEPQHTPNNVINYYKSDRHKRLPRALIASTVLVMGS